MKLFAYIGITSGSVVSVVTADDTVSNSQLPQRAGEVIVVWAWPSIDPYTFNESHWFAVSASGGGGYTFTINHYTAAQKAAKADPPDYPAVWSNTTMSWQDQRTLQQAKDARWAEFKAARQLMMQAPITVAGRTFDADLASQQMITGAVVNELLLEREGANSPGVEWTLADNTEVHLSAAQVFELGTQLAARSAMVFALFRAARTAIYACTTRAELDAITTPELPS